MARKKTSTVRANVKAQVSARLKEVRLEIFGEHGGPDLARRLNLPARTWYNYETGVTVPAEVLLGFIQQTGVDPLWLLSGQGARYRRGFDELALAELTPEQLIRRGLEKLEQEPREVPWKAGAALDETPEYLSLDLVSWSYLCALRNAHRRVLGRVLADSRWIANPDETLAVRLEDDAMSPILPSGSVVAVDRAIRDPSRLSGRLVAACVDGEPMVRWLELSGRHLILRPNVPSREHATIPIELDGMAPELIVGQVVWSWSKFGDS